MKWRLLTFGGGSARYEGAAHRLAREADATGWFDAVEVETAGSLATHHADFWRRHSAFVTSHPRLFGYGIWKPYLIRRHLEALPPDWGLVYLDAGCVLNDSPRATVRMHEYQEAAARTGLWATCLDQARWGHDSFPEECWTKTDALEAVEIGHDGRRSPQYQSGMIMLAPTTTTHRLVTQWEELSTTDNYSLSTDAPSAGPNPPCFVEHRHDQSLFSITAKSLGLPAVSDVTWFAPDWHVRGRSYPIWAARWRSGSPMRPWHPRYLKRAVVGH